MSINDFIKDAVMAFPVWKVGKNCIIHDGVGFRFSKKPNTGRLRCNREQHIVYRAYLFENAPIDAQYYAFENENLRGGYWKYEGKQMFWYDGDKWLRSVDLKESQTYTGKPTPEEMALISIAESLHEKSLNDANETDLIKAWEPEIGKECEISDTTDYFKHDKPVGHRVKIYSKFTDDRGVEMFAYVDRLGKVGGVGVARTFRPIKTDQEQFVEAALNSTEHLLMFANYDSYVALFGAMFDKGFRAPEGK